jgi:hypothetical protein
VIDRDTYVGNAYVRTQIRAYVCVYIYIYIYTYIYKSTCINVYMRTYIRKCIRTYLQIYAVVVYSDGMCTDLVADCFELGFTLGLHGPTCGFLGLW